MICGVKKKSQDLNLTFNSILYSLISNVVIFKLCILEVYTYHSTYDCFHVFIFCR